MLLRICLSFLALALLASGGTLAQTNIRTETIKPTPPPATAEPPAQRNTAEKSRPNGRFTPSSAAPEIITDLSRLPVAVARTRERILAAARSGDLQQLSALMSEPKPIFSFTDDKDPVAFWKASYPDSDGVEVLSILVTILETGFVRVDEGTQQEMYVWPYFVRMSLKAYHRAAEGRAVPDHHRRRLQGHDRLRRLCLLPARDRTGRHLALLRRRRLKP